MSEIATPRCDEKAFSLPGLPAKIVNVDFARSLERELAVARGKLEEIVNVFSTAATYQRSQPSWSAFF